jgi:hypothetical protein
MALERELATFQANLPTLVEKHTGRYVLVHGEQVIGVWDAKAEALEEGYRRFNLEPFLVKRIVADEKPTFVPRGILEQFLVLVTCRDAKQSVELLERFRREGLECKAPLA